MTMRLPKITTIKIMPMRLIAAALVGLAITSCSDGSEDIKIDKGYLSRSIDITEAEQEVSVQSNRFAWQLLQECISDKDENLVLSPLSANFCLSMLANAADGNTRAQILDAIGYTDQNMADVNSFNNKLAKQLCDLDKYVTLAFANSFWSSPVMKLRQTFVDDLNNNYNVETHTINSSTFIDDVNKWSKEKTKGLIPQILDSNSPLYYFSFMNALYFKGYWKEEYKFKTQLTQDDIFNNFDGTQTSTPFMQHTSFYPYSSTDTWEAIQIPFSGGAFRLTIVKPNEGYSIDDCLQSVMEFEPATGKFKDTEIMVILPKFKILQSIELNPILQKLGIREVFDEYLADLSNMSEDQTYIDMVKQAASFEVNEEGAEGAAVTFAGGFLTTALDTMVSIHPFIVNKPFIFILSESSTGAILFLGRINKF